MMGLEGKKKKKQPEAPTLRTSTDPEDVTLAERLQQLGAETVAWPTAEVPAPRQSDAKAAASKAAGEATGDGGFGSLTGVQARPSVGRFEGRRRGRGRGRTYRGRHNRLPVEDGPIRQPYDPRVADGAAGG